MNNIDELRKVLEDAPTGATHIDARGDYWKWEIDGSDYWMSFSNFRWEYKRVDYSIRSLADTKRIAELEGEILQIKKLTALDKRIDDIFSGEGGA